MSVQVFLQGKFLVIEEILLAPPASGWPAEGGQYLLTGRSRWISLLCEVLPRALLARLGLARVLLGSSGGGQFLVVVPAEVLPEAGNFLNEAGARICRLSEGRLRLVTAWTENLGDWSIVRKRLGDAMRRSRGTPAAGAEAGFFDPFETAADGTALEYFTRMLIREFQNAQSVGWSAEYPGLVVAGAGQYSWPVSSAPSADGITVARHAAMAEDSAEMASLRVLGERAAGRPTWGVLRGDVDNLGIRFRRIQTIEEHIQLSVMYKQFFAGELELVCSLPEFWRKITILYAGGDDFAIFGSWDALIPLAREIQRLFHRFCEENLKEFPGQEGKTITMAVAIADGEDATLPSVYAEAGRLLSIAKSTDKDCIHVLGHTLEWRQLSAASDLRETMLRMAGELDSPRRLLADLSSFYRKAAAASRLSAAHGDYEKPWQIRRYLNRALGETRDRELQRLRTHLTNEILVKGATHFRLRPGGQVALQWARLSTEGSSHAGSSTGN